MTNIQVTGDTPTSEVANTLSNSIPSLLTSLTNPETLNEIREYKMQFMSFINQEDSNTIFEQVFKRHRNDFVQRLKQSLYLVYKIAKKDEAFYKEMVGGMPLEIIHTLSEQGLEYATFCKYAMVACCMAIAVLPNLWKQDVQGLVTLLGELPSCLEKFGVTLTEAQNTILLTTITYTKAIVNRMLLNVKNTSVLVNHAVKLIESVGVDIAFDMVKIMLTETSLRNRFPQQLILLLLSPNAKQNFVPMLKQICGTASAVNGIKPGMSPIAMMTQLMRNMSNDMSHEVNQIRSQMDQFSSFLTNMSSQEQQSMVSQAMEMMGELNIPAEQTQAMQAHVLKMMKNPTQIKHVLQHIQKQ